MASKSVPSRFALGRHLPSPLQSSLVAKCSPEAQGVLPLRMDTIMDTKVNAFQQNNENRKVVAVGPVSRILSATGTLRDGHSSGPRITAGLKRPTRRL